MSFWSKLRRTIRPGSHSEEIDEEIQFHFAMKERDSQAHRRARIDFGNAAKVHEEMREAGILEWLESTVRDARCAFRQLHKARGLTAAIVLSLAIGIGSNTAIFSILDAALLRPLPVRDPQSLVILQWSNSGFPDALCDWFQGDNIGSPIGHMEGSSVAVSLFRRLARDQKAFSSVIGFGDPGKAIVNSNGSPEEASLQFVSANFFQGLGVPLPRGRSFSDSDDRAGQPPVVIISDRFWHSRFGGQDDVLGKYLHVNNVLTRIVGVTPRGFFGMRVGSWVDLYTPLATKVVLSPQGGMGHVAASEGDRNWWVRMMARGRPGQTTAQAVQQIGPLFSRIVVPGGLQLDRAKIPSIIASPGSRGFHAIEAGETRALWILLSLVVVVLVIVCANVANLLLARSVARRRESAVCLALGAPRLRLLRQHMVESFTLGLAGGLAGLLLGIVLPRFIHFFLVSSNWIDGFDLHPDVRVIGFTAGISFATVLVFGIAPALRATAIAPNDALKAHNRTVLGGGLRLPRILVSVQIAFCIAILIAAGLLSRTLLNLRGTNIGFERDGLAYANVNPWRAGFQAKAVATYVKRLRIALERIPGVRRVATIGAPPLSGGMGITVLKFPGKPFLKDGSTSVLAHWVSDGFEDVLGLRLVAGRSLKPRDIKLEPQAAVVDTLFAKKFFPNRNPLGQHFGIGMHPTSSLEVVGVVSSSSYNNLRAERAPILYTPLLPETLAGQSITFALRSARDPSQLAAEVRQAARSVDRNVPVLEFNTQTQLIDRTLFVERLLSILANVFGAVSLTLAAVGLAGLLSYSVALRKGELGIRMALGATRSRIVHMILKDLVWLAGAGILLGVPIAIALARGLKSTLYGVQASDPITLLLAIALLALIAVLAAILPARRAATVDPMVVLRDE